MALSCIKGTKECDGCMDCQSNEPVLYNYENEPIYEGDTFYYVFGDIVHEDSIYDYCDQFKRVANREGFYD